MRPGAVPRFEGGGTISYFLSNSSAKSYRSRVVYVKIIASQRWGVFETLVYSILICPV